MNWEDLQALGAESVGGQIILNRVVLGGFDPNGVVLNEEGLKLENDLALAAAAKAAEAKAAAAKTAAAKKAKKAAEEAPAGGEQPPAESPLADTPPAE